ncbi:hypothetical protein Q3G72_019451 [Acer saccharum]|nr:hypothetical protein Q3G72_019451 [Acer saccharum]
MPFILAISSLHPASCQPLFSSNNFALSSTHRFDPHLFSNSESSHLTNTNPRWTKTGQVSTTDDGDLAMVDGSFRGRRTTMVTDLGFVYSEEVFCTDFEIYL